MCSAPLLTLTDSRGSLATPAASARASRLLSPPRPTRLHLPAQRDLAFGIDLLDTCTLFSRSILSPCRKSGASSSLSVTVHAAKPAS